MDGVGPVVMNGAWCPPSRTPGIHTKEVGLGLIRPENSLSHGLRVLQVLFGELQTGFHVQEEWLPSALSTTRA